MSEILRKAKSSLDPIIDHHRQRTLEKIQGRFLNQANLAELGRLIMLRHNGGQALSIYGIVTGIHAEQSQVQQTEEANRGNRVVNIIRSMRKNMPSGEQEGSMLSIAGKYVNVWEEDPMTGQRSLRRELTSPTHIRGFAQNNEEKTGFTIPINPDYSVDPTRPISASYTRDKRGKSFIGNWPAGRFQGTMNGYRGSETINSIVDNDPKALTLALGTVLKMSDLSINWVRTKQESLSTEEAELTEQIPNLKQEGFIAA